MDTNGPGSQQTGGTVVALTPAATKPITEAATTEDLARVRELLVQTNPQAVAGMIVGHTVAELIESVATAKAEYDRVAAQVARQTPVSAGGGSRSRSVPTADLARLTPLAKITVGLRDRHHQ